MKWYISRADTFSARAKNRRRAQLFYFSLPCHSVSILGYILKNNWNFIIYVVFVGFYVFCTRIALNCILHFNVIMCIVFFFIIFCIGCSTKGAKFKLSNFYFCFEGFWRASLSSLFFHLINLFIQNMLFA